MFPRILLSVISCIAVVTSAIVEPRVAIVHLSGGQVNGSVRFTEVDNNRIHVTGNIIGLEAGHYGFHIHDLGDITTCYTTGGHFNPDGTNHGGLLHDVRHVGDFGNIIFVGDENAVATVDFVDTVITLHGRNSILGRALVLHEGEDDLGLGGDEMSLISGNAGPRAACGIVGILSPGGSWNSAKSVAPSTAIITLALFFMPFFKL